MYGLLLENLSEYVKAVYGEEKWEDIRRQAGIDSPSFSVHQVYPENMLNKLAKKAQQVLGVTEREFMDQMGVYFVGFVGQYGYDRVLSVLGRHMRDFLNGLDNLHEYLKFSYPRMRAPSFICENETRQGLTLHYRSKRRGFVYYTMGQIREVARYFYHKEMHIELVREEILFDTVHVTFNLTFDNRAFTLASLAMTREEKHLPISAHVLFEIFPFCIVFGADMVVRSIGNSLMVILPDLLGKKITTWFDLVRPLIAFKFQTILNRTNNIFELVTVDPVADQLDEQEQNEMQLHDDGTEPEKTLRLKGQMVYMDNWRMIMFLGTPVMPDLTSLVTTGLYINDLSMHDFSRDLMLAGTQQSVELKLALDQEQQKSKKLEESMRKLDEEMRRTDELLYQMIPKQVADRLRRGENPIDTCEMFDSVSILFSDVVTFTEICSRITPMEVVSMLNAMYSIFDTLTERNSVYKVETIGDAYMVVSGAPENDPNHAEKVCDMALDMVDAITDLKDPSTGQHLRIRVGVHSGAVVAGIVGLKMPRYCLFGDSVNTASRMESTSDAMKIHISQSTKEFLGPNYIVSERGEIDVKGKGTMKTYWLNEREKRQPLKLSSSGALPIVNFPTNVIKKNPDIRRQSSTHSVKALKAPPKLAEITYVSKIMDKEGQATNDITSSIATTNVTTNASNGHVVNSSPPLEDRNRIYSPVTFKDVARRSTANSPVRNLYTCSGRESRSNSAGHVHLQSPTDVFGSLILDTEEFLEDLQMSHRGSLANNDHNHNNSKSTPVLNDPIPPFRIGSAPSKPKTNDPDDFTPEELAAMEQLVPPATAPSRETTTTATSGSKQPIAIQSKERMKERKPLTEHQPASSIHESSPPLQTKRQQSPKSLAIPSVSTAIQTIKNSSSESSHSNSKDSLALTLPSPQRSMSAPLPMSKAARKALLAAKQTQAIEKLDKMIEEAQNDFDAKRSTVRDRDLRLHILPCTASIEEYDNDNECQGGCDYDEQRGCPLFLPPPPPAPLRTPSQPLLMKFSTRHKKHKALQQIPNSISDSSICNYCHSHGSSSFHRDSSCHPIRNCKMLNSHSFSHQTSKLDRQCCSGCGHGNERHSHHRTHSNACQLL